jgi:flavin-dependent dehydrogenase
MSYDVVVAGGSVAGLFCAREVAARGHSVLVIEEDFEIGTPEHCGGLVSTSGMEDLGVIPSGKTFDSQITRAEITSPNGKKITIDEKKQNVSVINRRELDKQVAHQAQKNGAEIRVRT